MSTPTTINTTEAAMGQCGDRPQMLSIGIAPLGIVSIGIVPMGVVSIGVVPMGVISLGVVGMGVINASVVGMGVLVAGLHPMGLWTTTPNRAAHQHPVPLSSTIGATNTLAYRSQADALKRARELGCTEVHRTGSLWMPCESHH